MFLSRFMVYSSHPDAFCDHFSIANRRPAMWFAKVVATRLFAYLSWWITVCICVFVYLFRLNRSGIKWTSSDGMRSIFNKENNAFMSSSLSLISS